VRASREQAVEVTDLRVETRGEPMREIAWTGERRVDRAQ
jgi:hypothetical protein